MSTLLAGRDTSACTLSWLFYELAYHPDVYAKLREEVLSKLGSDGKPTYENLKSMKYLQYCLSESNVPTHSNLTTALRLYPIVPFNVRSALVDTSLPRGGGPSGLDVRASLYEYTLTLANCRPERNPMWIRPLRNATSG